jgi:hypothetical protein
VGEEVFFRGFISRGLLARHGLIWGTLLTSLLFAVVHIEPVQATGAFVLGVGMQYVFLATRSLLAPIMLHSVNNTLAFALMKHHSDLPIPGLSSLPEGAIVHTPWPLLLAALAALIPVLALLQLTRTRWILPDRSEWSPGYVTAERPPPSLGARPVSRPAPSGLLALAAVTLALLIATAYWSSPAAVG